MGIKVESVVDKPAIVEKDENVTSPIEENRQESIFTKNEKSTFTTGKVLSFAGNILLGLAAGKLIAKFLPKIMPKLSKILPIKGIRKHPPSGIAGAIARDPKLKKALAKIRAEMAARKAAKA